MSESVFLGRKAILETQDVLAIEKVELTRGHVFVREMTGREKNTWEQSMMKKTSSQGSGVGYETTLDNYKAKLAVVTMCDEKGKLFLDMRDLAKVNLMMSASNLEKVVNAAQKINAISEEDKEDMLKNSEADQQDNSTSDSAEN